MSAINGTGMLIYLFMEITLTQIWIMHGWKLATTVGEALNIAQHLLAIQTDMSNVICSNLPMARVHVFKSSVTKTVISDMDIDVCF